jgi:hypothetical protein
VPICSHSMVPLCIVPGVAVEEGRRLIAWVLTMPGFPVPPDLLGATVTGRPACIWSSCSLLCSTGGWDGRLYSEQGWHYCLNLFRDISSWKHYHYVSVCLLLPFAVTVDGYTLRFWVTVAFGALYWKHLYYMVLFFCSTLGGYFSTCVCHFSYMPHILCLLVGGCLFGSWGWAIHYSEHFSSLLDCL